MTSVFSENTLEFLFENKLRDSREWFAAHKYEYQSFVIEPLRTLVQNLTPLMLELDPEFITVPKVDKTICRIWCDTRYSRDPSLYRDSMWIIFKRGGKMHGTDYPGVYFELSGSGFSYGCGFYNASTAYMNTLRSMIVSGSAEFQKADQAYRSQTLFRLEGDCFKRPRYTQYPENERDWLERRGLSLNAYSDDFELLFSEHLVQKLEEDLRQLFPVYRFLLRAAQITLQEDLASSMRQRPTLERYN